MLLLLNRFSHVQLCNCIDSSPPGSYVHGIFQARVLGWVAIAFSDLCVHGLLTPVFLGFPLWLSWWRICLQCRRPAWVWSLGWEDSLEKEMATHSSVLAWRIPGTGETGGLPSMGSHRVRHNWATFTFTSLCVRAKSLKSWPTLCDPMD